VGADRSIVRIAAPVVSAVDTTGAGDAFVGTFASALASGMRPEAAVALGVKVASLTVTRKGAQSSYPTQAEIATLS
jgi:ribokinase